MEKRRPLLSISMLVSNNRRDTIEKCMESLVPLLKAVPSELIIVDTGCTDGSVDIAGKYADKVVQFTWCKDFSAARNTGLRECTGEWFLYLDDDEWFEDVGEFIDFFHSGKYKKYDTVWYLQRNYDNFEGTSYTDTYVGRMVKLTSKTRFCGKIHEHLEPLPSSILKVSAYVHHYGYVYKNEEERQAHLMRNLTLEEEAVRENPKDIRMCCQLVQEYLAGRMFDKAVQLAKTTFETTEYEITNSFVQYLLLIVPRIIVGQKEYEKAIEEYNRVEKKYRLLHQSKLSLYYERARTYGYLKKEEESLREYIKYLKEFPVLPKKGDPYEYPIMDFAQYQSEFFYQNAVEYSLDNLICGELYNYAEELFSCVAWKKVRDSKKVLAALFMCYEKKGDVRLFSKFLPAVLRIPDMEEQVYGMIHSLYEKHQQDDDKSMSLLKDLESLKIQSGNFPFFHLLYTEKQGTTTERDIRDYYEKSDRKYDEEVALLLLGKAEKKLIQYSEQKKLGSIAGAMKEYVACAKSYADAAYGAEFWNASKLSGNPELRAVPGEIGFAHTMNGVLEEEDASVFGEGVKLALKFHPTMLPVVKAFLEERELMALAKQLKAVVRANLAEGKTEEAKAILFELAMMLPEDGEVKLLIDMC